MSAERREVSCPADAELVLAFLARGADLPFRTGRVRGSPSTVVFRTGMSAFSWGEQVEVTVVAQPKGSRLILRGTREFALNLTSNPRTPVDRIQSVLDKKFGPLQRA